MDPVVISCIMLASFSIFLAIGTPVFAALGVSSIFGMVLHNGLAELDAIPSVLHRGLTGYSLVCIPLFILMGEVMARSSIGARLYTMFALWLNRLPGGLGITSIGSSAVFGAMSGVSVAGAATIGKLAIPEMLNRGYHPGLASGTVAAAGSLALLIPPSIGFVLYGEIANQSIGRLFTAAMLPAVLLTALMMLYFFFLTAWRSKYAPRGDLEASWGQRWRSLLNIWPALILILLVLGTIYAGIATPTEAAGVGAVGAFIIAGVYRELTWNKITEIFRSTIITTGMILLILAAALLFGFVLTRLMIPQMLITWVAGLNQPDWIILLLILLFLLLVGMFLDIASVILITTPVLLPIITSLGYSPIWFGVILIITCEMAVITPPVGLNLYVIKGIAPQVSLKDITLGALPFVAVQFVAIVILTLFPNIALWLPSLM